DIGVAIRQHKVEHQAQRCCGWACALDGGTGSGAATVVDIGAVSTGSACVPTFVTVGAGEAAVWAAACVSGCPTLAISAGCTIGGHSAPTPGFIFQPRNFVSLN